MQVEQHMRNLRVIRGKVGKARTPKDHEAISKEITEAIRKIGCNPDKIFYTINNNSTSTFSVKKASQTRIGTKKIGEGEYGEVFFGCVDNQCKKDIAIKIQTSPLGREFRIGKLVSKFGGTKVYAQENCKGKHIMYSEYVNGGTLEDYIYKNITKLRPIHFRVIVTQMLYNLYRLHEKYPSFRHNDLHAKNVLVNVDVPTLKTESYKVGNMTLNVEDVGLKLLLNDYGLSTMKNIINPSIGGLRKEWGIDPKSHFMYDTHLFLNALFLLCSGIKNKVEKLKVQIKKLEKQKVQIKKLEKQKNKENLNKQLKNLKNELEKEKLKNVNSVNETIQFITRILPPEYLGGETTKIQNFRLRFGVDHSILPTFEQIFSDAYFLPYKSSAIKKKVDPLVFIPRAKPIAKPAPVVKPGTKKVASASGIQKAKNILARNAQKKVEPPKRRVIRKSPEIRVTLASKGYTRVDGKKCNTYKKSELIEKANKAGINTQGKTIEKICEALKIKYVK